MPLVAGAFILQGAFLGAIYGQNPAYLTERFPTEVRATASGFCYHQGAIWAGFTGPMLTYFAASQPLGFAVPMLIATTGAAIVFVDHPAVQPGDEGQGAGFGNHLAATCRVTTNRAAVFGRPRVSRPALAPSTRLGDATASPLAATCAPFRRLA